MTSKVRGGATQNRKTQKTTLSLASQAKLKKLLITIAKSEQQLEIQRQLLASNENVEPYSLFQRIDRGEDSFINSIEILNFLRDNGIHSVTEADCYYVVKFFDSDEDGRLNYPDFMQMILPCDNPPLRAQATQRPNMYIAKSDYLTLDVERDLTKLIMSEIELHRETEKIKQQLESALEYTEEGVYNSVDDWGYGFVDATNIKSFFRNNQLKATDEDCIAIIRRLDLDADSKLTKEEFITGLKAQEPYSKMIIREQMAKIEDLQRIKKQNQVDQSKGKKVNKKAEEGGVESAVQIQALDRSYRDVLSTSPLKKRVQLDLYGDIQYQQNQSPNAQATQSKAKNENMQTPNKNTTKSAAKLSPMSQQMSVHLQNTKSKSILKSSNGFDMTATGSPNRMMKSSNFKTPTRGGATSNVKFGMLDSNADFGSLNKEESILKSGAMFDSYNPQVAEQMMVNLFRDQLDLEKRLERVKIDLSLRTDFNLIDAFRVFDSEGKGWINPQEVKDGLAQLNVFTNLEDLKLYFSRYDKDEDGRLKYSEFCDSFLPIDAFHASLLAKKAPLHMYHGQVPKEKVFYQETRELFIQCWNTHIQNENEAEKIRLQLAGKQGFNPYLCFQVIDNKTDGYLDKEEVNLKLLYNHLIQIKELLIKYNLYVSEKEICALIDRYDRVRDGRITYSEFNQEISPKTQFGMAR
ncbi:ef hand family protein [Stylonychia lemnae]|uniref:Ef hand family protein n=1 Tax=Stylonychia lemnae TaxID=5949 RepID=A0A078A6T1_STYLE|nr:ef hand family protein [Stylonychia lemnae]|eukprot:CDW77960.1 ef hand family protein [Stylonychia lemnae]